MSTPPKMLQLEWARPRLIQMELHLSENGLAMHELRAAGIPERRIRNLYQPNANDYAARLFRLVLHEPFYTAAMTKFGDITKGASPFYPPLDRGLPRTVPTLLADGLFASQQLDGCSTDLMHLIFRTHGVPHEASRSSAALAVHLFAIPALLNFYHACASQQLDSMHAVGAMHVSKPWVFEEWVDFFIDLLEAGSLT